MAKSVGMVARLDRSEAISLVLKMAERFRGAGFSVLFEPCLAERIGERGFSMPLEHMETDLIVTVGGDGTILRTCLRIPKPEPPILAIGMGARGFLTEVLPEKALEAVDRYIEGLYRVEVCGKIASFIGGTRLPDALNEVFITSRHLAKTLNVRIWKNNVAVAEFSADGVIVASQVGSTAYSFSSGGPILDPEVDALVLTPVCPISLMRSMVLPSSSHVTVEMLRPKAAMIVIDGDYQKNIGDGETKVTVRVSEHKSRFIRFEDNFYKRLKDRLLFSREES